MVSFGWRPSIPDMNDYKYKLSAVTPLPLVDMREDFTPPYNQTTTGSCTSFAITKVLEYMHWQEGLGKQEFSKLFTYYQERVMEGTVTSDAGADIRDGMRSMTNIGVCLEKYWPFDPKNLYTKPPQEAYNNARLERGVQYQRVPQDETSLRIALTSGQPVICGFAVYESYFNATSAGDIPMPRAGEKQIGGHAIPLVGYNQQTRRFWFSNSYGENWGDGGFGSLPYALITDPNFSSDFWVIVRVA